MATSIPISQANFIQRNLVPEESNLVRKAMQNAAASASSDSLLSSRLVSVAYATAAVALSFFNTFTYLIVAACRVLVNITQFEFRTAFDTLGLGIFDSTRSFILGTLGVVYAVVGILFPETIYGVFCPSQLPPTIVQQLQEQLQTLEKEKIALKAENRKLRMPTDNRASRQVETDSNELIKIRDRQIQQLRDLLSAPADLDESARRALEMQRQTMQQQIDQLSAANQKLRENAESSSSDDEDSGAEIDRLIAENEQIIRDKNAEMAQLELVNAQFQNSFNETKAENEKWAEAYDELETDVREKENTIKQLNESIAEKNRSIKQWQTSTKNLQTSTQLLIERDKATTEQLQTLTGRVQQLELDLKNSPDEQIKSLAKQKATLEEDLKKVRGEYLKMSAEMRKLKSKSLNGGGKPEQAPKPQQPAAAQPPKASPPNAGATSRTANQAFKEPLSEKGFTPIVDPLKRGEDLYIFLGSKKPMDSLGKISGEDRNELLLSLFAYLEKRHENEKQKSGFYQIYDQGQRILDFILAAPSVVKEDVDPENFLIAKSHFRGEEVSAIYKMELYDPVSRKHSVIDITPIVTNTGRNTQIRVVEKSLWLQAYEMVQQLMGKDPRTLVTAGITTEIQEAFSRVIQVTGEQTIPPQVTQQGIYGMIRYVSTCLETKRISGPEQIAAIEDFRLKVLESGDYSWALVDENAIFIGGSRLPKTYDQIAFIRMLHILNFKKATTREEARRSLGMLELLYQENFRPDITMAVSQKGMAASEKQEEKDLGRVTQDKTNRVNMKYTIDDATLIKKAALKDLEEILAKGKWLEGKSEEVRQALLDEVKSYFQQGLRDQLFTEISWAFKNERGIALIQQVEPKKGQFVATYDVQTSPYFSLKLVTRADVVADKCDVLGVVEAQLNLRITEQGTESFFRWNVVDVTV